MPRKFKKGTKKMVRKGVPESKRGTVPAPYRLSTMPRAVVGGFPDKSRVRLAWAILATVDVTTTTVSRLTLSLNSIFDPGQAASSTQPSNFDTWASLYNYYRVHNATVNVRMAVNAYTGTTNGVTGFQVAGSAIRTSFCPFNTAAPTLVPRDVWTNPRARLFDLVAAKPLSYKATYDCATLLGLTNAQYMASDRTSALFSADPALQTFIDISYTNADTSLTQKIALDVQVVYDCEWWGRVPVDVDLAQRIVENRAAYTKHKGADFKPSIGVGPPPSDRVELKVDPKLTPVCERKVESKGDFKSLGYKKVEMDLRSQSDHSGWGDDCETDEDEMALFESFRRFKAYHKHQIAGSSAAEKQLDALENADFSGASLQKVQVAKNH